MEKITYVTKKGNYFWPNSLMKKVANISDVRIYDKARKNPVEFWDDLARKGLVWEKNWDETYAEKLPYFKWFKGGKLNFCVNCLDRNLDKPDRIAMIWVPEPIGEKTIKMTYGELYDKVNKFANVLRKNGVKKGEVVSIYLPMIPEVLISMLACARIGAVHSVVFSAFSADALKARIEDGKSKILITSDGYYRRGKPEPLLKKAIKASKKTTIKKIIVVKRIGKKIWGRKFLDFGEELKKADSYCKPEIMNSEDVLFVLYTSGCCHGKSLIQLADGEINKIEDLVEKNEKPKIINFNLNPIAQKKDNITYLHRYPVINSLCKIRTPSFEATFTSNHRLFSLNENGEVIEKEAGKLNVGDRVFVISKINVKGEPQQLPSLSLNKEYKNKTTYLPKNIPKIPSLLNKEFTQILGYFAGDGHLDKRSAIFTDKDKNNLIFYQKLIKDLLDLPGNIRKTERQRLFINSSLLREYIKEFFPEIICKSKERDVPKIIQKSENECVGGFLRGLFDAEGTVGVSFIKLTSTSEKLIRKSQLLLRRFGILAKVYYGVSNEREIRGRKIKETEYLDLIISERESLDLFYKNICFSDKAKKLKLEKLIKKLNSKKIYSKERFLVFSLLKEIPKTIKVDWQGEFRKMIPYLHYNQIDRKGLVFLAGFLDNKIKTETNKEKIKKLNSIKEKIEILLGFDGVVLEKILNVQKIDDNSDFVYDITAGKNHNYIVNGFLTHNTTGKPKGIVHDTGGYAVQAYWTSKWNFDLKENDLMWCTADVGWITGHTYAVYGPLLTKATTLIYEGGPDYPDPGRWWKIIEDNKVNIFYTAPTAIRMFMRVDKKWINKYDLSSIRLLGSVGEPIDKESWMWYFNKIGGARCPVIDTWWQTETGGTLINTLPGIGPFVPTISGKSFPGVSHIIVDDKGKKVQKNVGGFLVQESPFAPGMLHGVFNNHKKYLETYWRFKKFYDTSDGAYMQNDGLVRITGRTDDVMKVAGHRLTTAELENAIHENKSVGECAVVPMPDKIKGQVPIAFVVLKKKKPSEKLEKKLMKHVDIKIGPTARPKKFFFVQDLPKTRSGKIMRRILKSLLINEKPEGLMTLVNPESVEQIKFTLNSKVFK